MRRSRRKKVNFLIIKVARGNKTQLTSGKSVGGKRSLGPFEVNCSSPSSSDLISGFRMAITWLINAAA